MSKQQSAQRYIGRFAPSPSGPLHLGSLFAALGSYLQAKHQHGLWLVRIEDLDPAREVAGASENILRTLEYFHLFWDKPVVYQSQRYANYRDALQILQQKELVYPCICSRKLIQKTAKSGPLGMIYPGTCRTRKEPIKQQHSLRLMLPEQILTFKDKHQGSISIDLFNKLGDVILRRSDGLYAYHLAVTVDDYAQQITEVVRGRDLLYSTPIHNYLQHCLSYPQPDTLHLPVLHDAQAAKLSKQTGASRINQERPGRTLLYLLTLLGQQPPQELNDGNLDEILQWGVDHWQLNNVPKTGIQIDPDRHW